MKNADDRFQQHIHVFRGLAIILIVCAHTIPSLDFSENKKLGLLLDAIANQSSIYFFFIAGYLFQYLGARFSFRNYLIQKLKTVIFPYLILSIPALLVFTIWTKRIGMWPWFYDLPIWQQVGLFLLTGKHLAPLWFVPTIALFYLMAPIFLWIDRRFRAGYWIILPLLALSVYLGRGGQYGPLNFAQYLLPMYLLGMAFSRYRQTALVWVQRWWFLLFAMMVLGLCGIILEWPSPPYWQPILKSSTAALITWLLYRYHRIFGMRLDYIADVSFGIFFIHAYFIIIIKMLLVYLLYGHVYKGEDATVIPGSLLSFSVYVLVVIGVSVSVIWLVKRIFKKNSRMVIGA